MFHHHHLGMLDCLTENLASPFRRKSLLHLLSRSFGGLRTPPSERHQGIGAICYGKPHLYRHVLAAAGYFVAVLNQLLAHSWGKIWFQLGVMLRNSGKN
jgi:hypothetical protein